MAQGYECGVCSQSFGSSRTRNDHTRKEHPNHPKYRKSRLLTDKEAAAIREYFPEIAKPDGEIALRLADEFQINVQTIVNIALGKSYRRPSACPPGHPLRIALSADIAAKQRIRDKVSPAIRKQIRESQGGKCTYCLQEFGGKVRAHIDHIVPIVKGGESDIDNLQLLCSRCNQSKGGRTDEEYRHIVGRRIAYEREQSDWRSLGQPNCLDHNDECPDTCPYSHEYEGNDFQALWFMMDMRHRKKEQEQRFNDCPCHHYGCPPNCGGCYMCGHEPDKPNTVVCPFDEYGGITPCSRNCQGECLNLKDFFNEREDINGRLK